jgi:SAM-dependent methyltransferase
MDAGRLYEIFMGSGNVANTVAFLQWLVGRSGRSERPRVLDIGAGTGRLLGPLAALGWDAVGLEPRASYRARNENIRPGGFADLEERETFDAVLAVSDPFWYLLTDDSRRDALQRAHRALKPGGLLFLDGPNFLWILRNYRAPTPTEKESVRRTPSHSIDFHSAVWSHYDTFEIGGSGAVVRDEHHLAILTFPQLEGLLRDEDFDRIETFNGYVSRSSERLDGPRMLVAAWKS